MKSTLEHHNEKIDMLSVELNELKITVSILAEKHLTLIEKLDSFVDNASKANARLQKLEEFMIMHVERTAVMKSFLKLWPVILATLLFSFSLGVMVDNQKVAEDIANKIRLKSP